MADISHAPPATSQQTESLVKRLAGPSTGKAGYVWHSQSIMTPWILCYTAFSSLAKDQTEINRIIAEASKGSKFYEVN
jgi:DNA polymerase kappa